MKGFFLCAALLVLVAVANGDDIKDKFGKAFDKCKGKHPISEDEVQKLKGKDIDHPYSKEAQCFMACFFEEGKILQNGKYNKENALVMAEVMHKDNPEDLAKAKEILETCVKENPEVGPDQCEFAYKMLVCGAKEAKKVGLDKTDIFSK